jgi:succinate dehydrogenase / fumarate reductase flavoprotein subunit
VPRDVASRAAKERCDAGYGVGTGLAVYLDFEESLQRLGRDVIEERYGNLFQMYEQITGENPYTTPMMIYPAVHYTMGGLWVDYELMTNIPGLYAIGEVNFSDHGANRLGASALMQGLADGYFILPYTIGNYLAGEIHTPRMTTNEEAFNEAHEATNTRINDLMAVKGNQSVDHLHKRLGHIMWEYCGMGRNEEGLKKGQEMLDELEKDIRTDIKITGDIHEYNPELEKAARLQDFLELGKLMMKDALLRRESCGGHFREEMQTPEGEAKRDDENFAFVAAWECRNDDGKMAEPLLHKEELKFEVVELKQRVYK